MEETFASRVREYALADRQRDGLRMEQQLLAGAHTAPEVYVAEAARWRAQRQTARAGALPAIERLVGRVSAKEAAGSDRMEALVALLQDPEVWQALAPAPANTPAVDPKQVDSGASASAAAQVPQKRVLRPWASNPEAEDRSADPARRPSGFQVPRRLGADASGRGGQGTERRAPGSQETSAPAVDRHGNPLPEVVNVEPRLVEMIMNEVLEHAAQVTWEDIAGLEYAKRCVMEAVVWPMQRPDLFTGLRGPPRGLLLFGPPGTGKTMIGRAIASRSGAKFFNISASSLMSKWVGESEKLVRALFGVARALQPAVIFIDEIDSMLSARSDSDAESSRRVKTEFLVQMDGASSSREDRVLVIGASNRPQELDQACRRRMPKRLYIPLPDEAARRTLVLRLIRDQAHDLDDAALTHIVRLTHGYSGSDVYALCAEAALGPVRDLGEHLSEAQAADVRPMALQDFVQAARVIRKSVAAEEVRDYEVWNAENGSFPIPGPSVNGGSDSAVDGAMSVG